jgi:hypothetical protein
MYRGLRAFTAAALIASAFGIVPSFAQKSGGILRVHAIDSPPSLSMHEEIDAVPARLRFLFVTLFQRTGPCHGNANEHALRARNSAPVMPL